MRTPRTARLGAGDNHRSSARSPREYWGNLLLCAMSVIGLGACASGGEYPQGSTDSSLESQQNAADEVVLLLPTLRRSDERVLPGGHQPWRSDAQYAAMVELATVFKAFNDARVHDDHTYKDRFIVTKRGRDSLGRPTVVINCEVDAPFWRFDRCSVAVHLFLSNNEVWVADRIVIREIPR